MSKNNSVVLIEIGGRNRELRFGHKALMKLEETTGMSMDEIGSGKINFRKVGEIIYCGILDDARKNAELLTLEGVHDMLDEVSPQYYMDKMNEAISKSFGYSAEGNGQGK